MNKNNYYDFNKEIIRNLLRDTYRPGMPGLILYMETNGFFEAPCSAGHHLACDGGLAKHSLSVYRLLRHLIGKYDIPISSETIVITALLHDICKVHFYEKKDGKWQYKENLHPGIKKGHGESSVYIIEGFIKLSDLEKEMITWHMGPYSEYYDGKQPGDFLKWSTDKQAEFKNFALLLYFCDHFSSMFLEDE